MALMAAGDGDGGAELQRVVGCATGNGAQCENAADGQHTRDSRVAAMHRSQMSARGMPGAHDAWGLASAQAQDRRC